jgi:hypothetical protein
MTDTGQADPRLTGALDAYDGTPAAHAEVVAALAGARVFVAITATSTAEHVAPESGLRAESSAEMTLVSLVASDGARAIPTFTDATTLVAWRVDFRPVPVQGRDLARAALDDGAAAVLLDPTGAAVVVRRDDLTSMAARWSG